MHISMSALMQMTKIERVRAALRGEKVDRLPYSVWYHFGMQFRDGLAHAEVEHAFYKRFDLDFLKVMNDYDYPRAEGMYDVVTPEDWRRLPQVSPWNYDGYKQELTALRELSRRLGSEAYFIDTIFSPWTTARNICWKNWRAHMNEHPDDFLAGMETITVNLERLVSAMMEVGTSGIFLSVAGAAKEYLTWEEYERFGKPFDLRILKAAEGAPMNVLHIHGGGVPFQEMLGYQVNCVNWADRDPSNPRLADARKQTKLALMGGIDHEEFKELTLAEIQAQADDAHAQLKGRAFILAPGCSLKTNTLPRQIDNLRDAAHRLRVGS
jgi:uroporphyrinogen decarboxylase